MSKCYNRVRGSWFQNVLKQGRMFCTDVCVSLAGPIRGLPLNIDWNICVLQWCESAMDYHKSSDQERLRAATTSANTLQKYDYSMEALNHNASMACPVDWPRDNNGLHTLIKAILSTQATGTSICSYAAIKIIKLLKSRRPNLKQTLLLLTLKKFNFIR